MKKLALVLLPSLALLSSSCKKVRTPSQYAADAADQIVFVEKRGRCFAIYGEAIVLIPCASDQPEAP